MTSQPLVSVVIPVRNGERFLREALDSVLTQVYEPLELIVVDDGSSDGSLAVARSFGSGVRVFTQPPSGVAAALNHGVSGRGVRTSPTMAIVGVGGIACPSVSL